MMTIDTFMFLFFGAFASVLLVLTAVIDAVLHSHDGRIAFAIVITGMVAGFLCFTVGCTAYREAMEMLRMGMLG